MSIAAERREAVLREIERDIVSLERAFTQVFGPAGGAVTQVSPHGALIA